jgi:hypothetical protein
MALSQMRFHSSQDKVKPCPAYARSLSKESHFVGLQPFSVRRSRVGCPDP